MMGLGVISKYRTRLMGIAAILILVCHAPGNNVLMPQFLLRLCEQGQYGVDIFLFLSGVGLSYSMQKANLQKTGMGALSMVFKTVQKDFSAIYDNSFSWNCRGILYKSIKNENF